MKFLRYGPPGAERPAVIDTEGVWRDIGDLVPDITGAAFARGPRLGLDGVDLSRLPVVDPAARIGACVGAVPKFICIGLNYSDHAKETGAEIPPEPVIFTKANSAICGPNDDVIRPRGSEKLDWEVELGLVIGKRARYVPIEAAMDHVFGYCVVNDVSEREYQMERHGTWDKGKGCDTFGPIGPWLVTRDEVADPCALGLWLDVNGVKCQNGTTATMIYKPDFLVSYVSQFMTLVPGDIISTGTPPGVGMGQKPPRYLKPGDVMDLGIDGLGVQRQRVVDFRL